MLPMMRAGHAAGGGTPATHTITITNSGVGVPPMSIVPAGPVIVVNHGENQSVQMVDLPPPSYGWGIGSLIVDGVDIPEAYGSADYTYTFTNVITNHTLVVAFELMV